MLSIIYSLKIPLTMENLTRKLFNPRMMIFQLFIAAVVVYLAIGHLFFWTWSFLLEDAFDISPAAVAWITLPMSSYALFGLTIFTKLNFGVEGGSFLFARIFGWFVVFSSMAFIMQVYGFINPDYSPWKLLARIVVFAGITGIYSSITWRMDSKVQR